MKTLVNQLVLIGQKQGWTTWTAIQRYVEKHPRKYFSITFKEIGEVAEELEIEV